MKFPRSTRPGIKLRFMPDIGTRLSRVVMVYTSLHHLGALLLQLFRAKGSGFTAQAGIANALKFFCDCVFA